MTTLSRSTGIAGPRTTSEPKKLIPQAALTDRGQKVSVAGSGDITLSGAADTLGTVAKSLVLTFEGHTVKVDVSGGQTALRTMQKLDEALPRGYRLVRTASNGGTVKFYLEREGSRPRSNVADINRQFARATAASSTAGARLSVEELREAVAIAESNGLTRADKAALARNWAQLFTPEGVKATPAAQKEFARLQARLGLTVPE